MTDYVVGFAFDKVPNPSLASMPERQVLLVQKARPAWQKGRLNGVGGHVEAGELPFQAMPREFFEETGIFSSVRDWHLFAVVHTDVSRVFMFAAALDLAGAKGAVDEPVMPVYLRDLPHLPVLPNLLWLVPMALRAPDLPVPAIVHEVARYEAA